MIICGDENVWLTQVTDMCHECQLRVRKQQKQQPKRRDLHIFC